MKARILAVAVLSAVMGMVGTSYASDTDATSATTTLPPGSSNAATPAIPGKDGTAATPAVPGNPTARAAIKRGETLREERGMSKDHADVDSTSVERPEVTRPEVTRPEVTRPEVTRPEIEH